MIGRLTARQAGLLPPSREDGWRFLPAILALAAFVAALAAIGLVVVEQTLGSADAGLATALTLQVPADTSSARLETVIATLRQTRGIVSEHLFEPAETARLLEPWLGPAVPLDELPVPRLVDIRIDPTAPPDVETLRRQIAAVLPQARLDDHRTSLSAMRAPARRIEIVLAAAIAAALLLMLAATAFAVRAALMIAAAEFEVLHLLGADDSTIADELGMRYLRLGLVGGAIGALAGLVALAMLQHSGLFIELPAPAATAGVADWRCWLVLLGTIAAAGLIAMAGARHATLRWLGQMP